MDSASSSSPWKIIRCSLTTLQHVPRRAFLKPRPLMLLATEEAAGGCRADPRLDGAGKVVLTPCRRATPARRATGLQSLYRRRAMLALQVAVRVGPLLARQAARALVSAASNASTEESCSGGLGLGARNPVRSTGKFGEVIAKLGV